MAEFISLDEAKDQFLSLVERAAAGEEFIISINGAAVARLAPMIDSNERRKPAGALGITAIAEDFDAPLPADILSAFLGRP